MPRTGDAATFAAFRAPHVGDMIGLAVLSFDSADVRLASSPFTVPFDWNGAGAVDFLGVGALGKISAVEEAAVVQPYSIALELSGVDPAFVALALTEPCQGRPLRIWRALIDQDRQFIGAPVLEFRGRMDVMKIYLGRQGRVVLTAHSRLADWDKPRVRRFTDADQRARWSDDRFLEYVGQTADKELVWGQ